MNTRSKAIYLLGLISFFGSMILHTAAPMVHATSVGVGLLETPSSITVDPASATISVGNSQNFVATAHFLSGAPDMNITNNPLNVWASDSVSVASVNSSGLATGLNQGNANITATYGGKSGSAVLTVTSSSTPPDNGDGNGGSGDNEPGGEEPGGEEPSGEEPTGEEPSGEEPSGEEPAGEEPEPQGEGESPSPPAPGEEQGPNEIPSPTIETSSNPSAGEDSNPSTSGPNESETDFQFITPPVNVPGEFQSQVSEVFLPDELSVTRGETLQYMIDKFSLEDTYKDLLKNCYGDMNSCLSIFLSTTTFDGVILDAPDNLALGPAKLALMKNILWSNASAAGLFDFGKTQLYPDVPPNDPYSYAVNLGTILSVVQGYYEEPGSPFKPYQVISRIEATKVILGSVDIMDWMYYPELETILGGVEGVQAQKTPFADVHATRDYMWWYPRYVNTSCEMKMVDCKEGSNFRPDDYITEAEFKDMIDRLRASLDESGYIKDLDSDSDEDNLKNYIEKSVYLTDPLKKDTDDDKLNDGEEVSTYKTSPFRGDSDDEGLGDYDEVFTYKTDPLKPDTDEDDYTDFVEVQAGSDPLDPLSYPTDEDTDGIADDWEQKYGFNVVDGTEDHDLDGVSDKLEYQFGTDPSKSDSDGDGFSDAEEILQFGTDPLNADDPGTIENLGVRITNFSENQLVGDTTPIVKGIGPLGAEIRIVLHNDYGHEKVLGSTTVDENNVFIFQVEEPLRDGRYILVARALEPTLKRIVDSPPIHIKIDSTLNVVPPAPKQLSDQEITDEVLLKNLRIRIRDNRPVLVGQTEFGNRITATWRSIVTTSALIADAASGEFEIEAPTQLLLGNHEVYVSATRKKDNAQSDTVKLLFNVATPSLISPTASGSTLKGAAEQQPKGVVAQIGSVFVNIGNFATQQGFLFWLIVAVVIVIVGATVYYFYTTKPNKKKE